MKAPRPRVHIIESHDSLQEGGEQKTLCEITIKRSKFVAMSDTGWLPGERVETQPQGICKACAAVRTLRYLAVEAGEFKDLE
jgi:hypothetical protein